MNARAQALARGEKTYQGARCKRGHSGERYTSNGACFECVRELNRKYRATATPEQTREFQCAYHAANREKIREQRAAYHAANREELREQQRAHRAANAEKLRERDRKRYAANKDKRRQAQRAYNAANPEKLREQKRAYRAANPGTVRAINASRRALRKSQRCMCCTDAEIKAVYDIAALCGPGAHVDHTRPLSLGGPHCAKNLVALTAEEHIEKTRRDLGLIADARRGFTSPRA